MQTRQGADHGSQTDRVALVTGASSGIGEAAARALVGAGFTVYGTSRRATPGETRGDVVFLPLDVTDDESVADAVREVLDRSGRIDVLVNNAGLGVAGAAEESSVEQARALFETNLFGSIRMTRAVLPPYARAAQRKDHQRQLDRRSHPGPLHGVVRVEQARPRGLLRVGRPRGARARSPRPAGRARVHQDLRSTRISPPPTHRFRSTPNNARSSTPGLPTP